MRHSLRFPRALCSALWVEKVESGRLCYELYEATFPLSHYGLNLPVNRAANVENWGPVNEKSEHVTARGVHEKGTISRY